MLSADQGQYLATFAPDAHFFWSHALEQDEWAGRNQALLFAWKHYGQGIQTSSAAGDTSKRVNIIGPSLGCFNAPADLYELKRLIRGIGGEINLVYPYESSIIDTPHLADAAANVVMYHEFGEPLAQQLQTPYLFAPFGVFGTTRFLRELGDMLGTPREQVEAFIAEEKRTTLRLVWDLWRGPQSDWFATVDCAIVAARSYADGLRSFLHEELGMKVVWSCGQPRREDEPDNIEIRSRLHTRAPTFVFGSINEKIYLAEASARSSFFIPATFPGPVVRRTFGTPFMGYAGAAYIMQELVNRLYETVFTFLPVEPVQQASNAPGTPGKASPAAAPTSADSGQGGHTTRPQAMPWTSEATTRLNTALDAIPYLSRISASRTLRQAAEQAARDKGADAVTAEVIEAVLQQG
jgi:chlorophyllide a reductase subunit Z